MDRTIIPYKINHIDQKDFGDIAIESLLKFPFSKTIKKVSLALGNF